MNVIVKLIITLFIGVIVTGCNDKTSLQDLLDHPALLKKEITHCQSAANQLADAQKQWCQIVLAAGSRFMGMVAERETDPEKFGSRIIAAEEAYAAAKRQVQVLQQTIADLNAKQASAAELQKAQDQLIQAQKNYREKQQEVKLLLAVVGTSAPN